MNLVSPELDGILAETCYASKLIDTQLKELGSPDSLGLGAGLFAGLKNVGRDKMYSPTTLF